MKNYYLWLWLLPIIINSCQVKPKQSLPQEYIFRTSQINVDGKADDWDQIKGEKVNTEDKLWIGQNLVRENWNGPDDLSFTWKACHNGNKLYFLFEVTDDILVEPANQPNSFLNDCIEILLDPKNTGGPRFIEKDSTKTLNGYELHFLPASPNFVFLNDSIAPMYPINMSQNQLFLEKWKGEIACTKTAKGYILELGFELPNVTVTTGMQMGIDVDVCDDDGLGRKSLMIWSGTQKEFWLTMDDYPDAIFENSPIQ